jgi:hypothetical protein
MGLDGGDVLALIGFPAGRGVKKFRTQSGECEEALEAEERED